MGDQLLELGRCPSCSAANPVLVKCWASNGKVAPNKASPAWYWGTFVCTTCNELVLAKGMPIENEFVVMSCVPTPRQAHEDIPVNARRYLQQAYDTLHAPDAAAVMAASAVDAMLEALLYEEGSLYARIDQALKDNIITSSMAQWAHSVRLGANKTRHADKDTPHITEAEAKQAVEFAEALGQFLFVLSARVKRGIDESQKVNSGT